LNLARAERGREVLQPLGLGEAFTLLSGRALSELEGAETAW
jgi:hypothetical protein